MAKLIHREKATTSLEWLLQKERERNLIHREYESGLIFDDRTTGVYDRRDIPFPLVPKNHAWMQKQKGEILLRKLGEGRELTRDDLYFLLLEVKGLDVETHRQVTRLLISQL
jgi:hypothetical protein